MASIVTTVRAVSNSISVNPLGAETTRPPVSPGLSVSIRTNESGSAPKKNFGFLPPIPPCGNTYTLLPYLQAPQPNAAPPERCQAAEYDHCCEQTQQQTGGFGNNSKVIKLIRISSTVRCNSAEADCARRSDIAREGCIRLESSRHHKSICCVIRRKPEGISCLLVEDKVILGSGSERESSSSRTTAVIQARSIKAASPRIYIILHV